MEKDTKETSQEERIEDEINLLDYLIVLAKRKKLIIAITFSVAVITAIYSLTLPFIYRAQTNVLPPANFSGRTQFLMREFGAFANLIDTSNITANLDNPYVIIGILKSRPVYERMVDRFGLMEKYKKAKDREEVIDMLDGRVHAELNDRKSPVLTISVTDKDPETAADMANAFVETLQDRLQELALTEASRRRLFFEQQLKQVKEDLIISEEAMREFQEKTGVLKVESQAEAVIGSIANLRAQIAAKEVELKVMRTYSTPNNPDLQRVEETLKGLKIELAKLEEKGGGRNPDPLMPTGRMPAVGTDYVRKLRDLKFNETLYEMMLKQYETAKIDEAKDPLIIQVIEKAIPQKERVAPARRKMVMIATSISFFFSVFLAFIMEYFERQKSISSENKERIETLKRYLSFRRRK